MIFIPMISTIRDQAIDRPFGGDGRYWDSALLSGKIGDIYAEDSSELCLGSIISASVLVVDKLRPFPSSMHHSSTNDGTVIRIVRH